MTVKKKVAALILGRRKQKKKTKGILLNTRGVKRREYMGYKGKER